MAPTTMSNPDGKKRVKTGRIDARAIARILAYKSYSQVHLPGEEMEALKEYTRARDAKKSMFKKAKDVTTAVKTVVEIFWRAFAR